MTIESLQARRAELLARRREEEALRAAGRGDNMAWFVVNEELLEVNARLRQLQGKGRRIGGRTVSADAHPATVARQAAQTWREGQGEDTDTRAALKAAVGRAGAILTPRQAEAARLIGGGLSAAKAAEAMGVDKSTAWRTWQRARERLQAEAETQEAARRREGPVLDLADRATAQAVCRAVTAKQAVYLYLYYAEWLSLRQIAALCGLRDHTTVLRSIRAGLRNIARAMGGGALTLENLEALDALAYEIYSGMDEAALLPPAAQARIDALRPKLPRRGSRTRQLRSAELPDIRIRAADGRAEDVRTPGAWRRCGTPRGGRLITALRERMAARSAPASALLRALQAVFRRLCGKNRGRGVRRVKK